MRSSASSFTLCAWNLLPGPHMARSSTGVFKEPGFDGGREGKHPKHCGITLCSGGLHDGHTVLCAHMP